MKTPRYTDNPARFRHVDLHETNLYATFARIRKEQREAKEKRDEQRKVVDIKQATLRG